MRFLYPIFALLSVAVGTVIISNAIAQKDMVGIGAGEKMAEAAQREMLQETTIIEEDPAAEIEPEVPIENNNAATASAPADNVSGEAEAAVITNPKSDIEKDSQNAMTQYMEGNYTGAIESLENVIILIRDYTSAKIKNLLPAPTDGWTAREIEFEDDTGGKYGNPIAASMEYTNGGQIITVSIILSPRLLKDMLMLANVPGPDKPTFHMYKNQKAIFDRDGVKNTLKILIGDQGIVAISGDQLSHTDANVFADNIDLDSIVKFALKDKAATM